jgi:preprotein translocase subunit YajC
VIPALLLQADQPNPILGFLPMIVIFAIFYFLLFMPMQRQKKHQKQMLASLKAGDVVQTAGGMIGTIIGVNDDTIILRVRPDNLKIEVARSAIAGVLAENP